MLETVTKKTIIEDLSTIIADVDKENRNHVKNQMTFILKSHCCIYDICASAYGSINMYKMHDKCEYKR